ncbi:MAG: ABC transporter ATP-binding protein [Desulfobacterales bacterium]
MAFELDKICFSYGAQAVIENLSLSIRAGCFHAILGPNGCGKTTLLDLLSGYIRPSSGTILFNGKNLSGYSKRLLASRIALVPQEYRVNFPYTVREMVAMGRYPHQARFSRPTEKDSQAVDYALNACMAEELSERFITELSGGEKQRVIFARAVAQQTSVLLLDEPCASMDVKHALRILKVALGLVMNNKVTVVAVMHDINLAARFADNLIFMKGGCKIVSGPVNQSLDSKTIQKVFDVESLVSVEQNLNVPQVVFLR